MARVGRDVEVVVVGAGLAGLAAADRLARAGRAVAVLEAADQVGGRTRSGGVGGEPVDFGAEWVGGRHQHMLALLRRLGLPTRRTYQLAVPILWRTPGGAPRMFVPSRGPGTAALLRMYAGVSRLSRRVDVHAPWRTPGAAELDRLDVRSWLASQGLGNQGLTYVEKVLGGLTSAPLRRLSLLHLLWLVRRGGGMVRATWTTFERHVPGGTQQVARRLAEGLGDAVQLAAPVERIVQDGAVEIETGDATIRAAAAVVAVPLGRLSAIAFDPPLTPEQARLDEVAIGPGTKVSALLPERARPLHRMVVGGDPLDGAWRVGRRVTGFASPPDSEAPELALVTDLAAAFGVAAGELRDPHVFRWSEHAWVPGCDAAFAPGQLVELGPHLRRPHGRVQFAGTERSSWPNNMEGAVESGLRAAAEVERQLAAR